TVIQASITTIDRNVAVLNMQAGALGATSDKLSDLDGLVVQASNSGGLTGSELGAIRTHVSGVLSGIDRISSATGVDIMHDVTTHMVVGHDESTGDAIYETVSLSDLSRVVETDPEAAQRLVDGARDAVLQERAQVGADQRAQESEQPV